MKLFLGLGLAYVLVFVAFVILATKVFYPHHRIVAFFVFAISFIPFIITMRHKRLLWIQNNEAIRGFFTHYSWHIVLGVFLVLFLYVLFVLIPVKKSVLTEYSDEELRQYILDDIEVYYYLDDGMTLALNDLEQSGLLKKEFDSLLDQEIETLKNIWKDYVTFSFELDLLKTRYEGFYQLKNTKRPLAHARAFLIGYASLVSQYTHALRATELINENKDIRVLLNQQNSSRGISKNVYAKMKQRLTSPNEILRLNAGRAYLAVIKDDLLKENDLIKNVHEKLESVDASLKKFPSLFVKNPLERIEKLAFKAWFPLQKKAAVQLSYIRTARRDYLITPNKVQEMKKRLKPGDIFLQRREWHATNVGIPGFWTHSALYIGTLAQIDEYFKDAVLLKGQKPSEFIKKENPSAYEKLVTKDEDGFKRSVIESKRPGVIITSLEFTTNADSVAVLRPMVSKDEKFQALMIALSHFGKPYDFNFDFRTDNALVCSELIYRAYKDSPNLTITPVQTNGRPLFSPNQFAQKFDSEFGTKNQDLMLVAFLDGSEKQGTAIERDAEAFRESWKRPKWHILKEYVN